MKFFFASTIAVLVAACTSSSDTTTQNDAAAPSPAQSACIAACNHLIAAGCAHSGPFTNGGDCTQQCIDGTVTLPPQCDGTYATEYTCFANAAITCDPNGSVGSSLASACSKEVSAQIACLQGADAATPVTPSDRCAAAVVPNDATCQNGGYPCAVQGSAVACCPPTAPFACIATGNCYASGDEAAAFCSDPCVACKGAPILTHDAGSDASADGATADAPSDATTD